MFNIGGGEVLVILVIALIVLGPKRLPDAARTIGKTMGDLRRLSTGFQNEVRTALNTADDPDQVASRRNLLARDEPAAPAPEDHPVRTTPLVAAPLSEAGADEPAPTKPAAKRAPAKPRPATTKASPSKAAKPKNGTAVEKPAPSKATRRAKS